MTHVKKWLLFFHFNGGGRGQVSRCERSVSSLLFSINTKETGVKQGTKVMQHFLIQKSEIRKYL